MKVKPPKSQVTQPEQPIPDDGTIGKLQKQVEKENLLAELATAKARRELAEQGFQDIGAFQAARAELASQIAKLAQAEERVNSLQSTLAVKAAKLTDGEKELARQKGFLGTWIKKYDTVEMMAKHFEVSKQFIVEIQPYLTLTGGAIESYTSYERQPQYLETLKRMLALLDKALQIKVVTDESLDAIINERKVISDEQGKGQRKAARG